MAKRADASGQMKPKHLAGPPMALGTMRALVAGFIKVGLRRPPKTHLYWIVPPADSDHSARADSTRCKSAPLDGDGVLAGLGAPWCGEGSECFSTLIIFTPALSMMYRLTPTCLLSCSWAAAPH